VKKQLVRIFLSSINSPFINFVTKNILDSLMPKTSLHTFENSILLPAFVRIQYKISSFVETHLLITFFSTGEKDFFGRFFNLAAAPTKKSFWNREKYSSNLYILMIKNIFLDFYSEVIPKDCKNLLFKSTTKIYCLH